MINISKDAARRFVETWTGRGHERSESQTFWIQLLQDVFGVKTPAEFITFELPVRLKNAKFIDAYIPSTKVLIEQKSSTEDLRKAKRQSDNTELTPYEQAIQYDMWLPYSKRARWIVISNFTSFDIYDMEDAEEDGIRTPLRIELINLADKVETMRFLVEDVDAPLWPKSRINEGAFDCIERLKQELKKRYVDSDSKSSKYSLNVLCDRLMYCFRESDIQKQKGESCTIIDYTKSYKPRLVANAWKAVFEVLSTPQKLRSSYLEDELKLLPYVDDPLFTGCIEIPQFTPSIANIILNECYGAYDWSELPLDYFTNKYKAA